MDRTRYLQWTLSANDAALGTIGYRVELSDDPSFSRSLIRDNSFDAIDEFEVKPIDTWEPITAGLPPWLAGSPIRYRLQSAKFLQGVVIAKNGWLHRLGAYNQKIAESLDIRTVQVRYLSVNQKTNDVWVTGSNDTVHIVPVPFSQPRSLLLPANAAAVIPDGARNRYWVITDTDAILYRMTGEQLATCALPAYEWLGPITLVPQTGDLYLILRNGTWGTFVHCETSGTVVIDDSATYRDFSIWLNGALLVSDSNKIHYYHSGSVTLNWQTVDIPNAWSISAMEGDSVYVLNAAPDDLSHTVHRYDPSGWPTGGTATSDWSESAGVPGVLTALVRADFDMNREGRIVNWWSCREASAALTGFSPTFSGSVRDFAAGGAFWGSSYLQPDDQEGTGTLLSPFALTNAWARITPVLSDDPIHVASSYSESSSSSSSSSTVRFTSSSSESSSSSTVEMTSSSSSSSPSSSSSRGFSSSSSSSSPSSHSSNSSSSSKSSSSSSNSSSSSVEKFMILTPSPLPTGNIDSAYGMTLTASGHPVTWSVILGSLPTGLSMSLGGVISGTPTTQTTYTFTVQVVDLNSVAVSKVFSLGITAKPNITSSPYLPGAVGGAPYSETLTATDGYLPYTWSLAPYNYLPAGMSLSSGGVISGPSEASSATYSMYIRVTGANSEYSDRYFYISIRQDPLAPVPVSTIINGFVAGHYYSAALAATGGVAPYTWSLFSGSLPTGLFLSSAGVIAGTPSFGGGSMFYVKIQGANGHYVVNNCAIYI